MDQRILRELELDGVARLYSFGETDTPAPREVTAASAPIAKAPAAIRTWLADPVKGEAAPWQVAGSDDMFDGDAGRLVDAMLAAVGMRRRDTQSPATSSPALVLLLGDSVQETHLPTVPIADPRVLLRQPAGKAEAWEALVRARRLTNG